MENEQGSSVHVCPLCCEPIRPTAKKCPHCHEWVTPEDLNNPHRSDFDAMQALVSRDLQDKIVKRLGKWYAVLGVLLVAILGGGGTLLVHASLSGTREKMALLTGNFESTYEFVKDSAKDIAEKTAKAHTDAIFEGIQVQQGILDTLFGMVETRLNDVNDRVTRLEDGVTDAESSAP